MAAGGTHYAVCNLGLTIMISKIGLKIKAFNSLLASPLSEKLLFSFELLRKKH